MHATKIVTTLLLSVLWVASLAAQGIVELRPGGRIPNRPHPHVQPRHRWQPVAVKSHRVKAQIDGKVAQVKVTQVFHNPNSMILEGQYIFPIPEGASLTEFTMDMNGKTVQGEILERDKARKIYEGIVRRQQDPALLEYMGRNLFRARVFPIPAKGDVKVSLSYVQELIFDGGIGEFSYPLKTQAFANSVVNDIALDLSIKSDIGVKTVFSSSHKIDKSRKSKSEVRVTFEAKNKLATKDFHLFYTLSSKDLGVQLLSHNSTRDGGYFMMTLTPGDDTSSKEIANKEIVFVLDTSGSMQDAEKMAQAKAALIYGLRNLNPGDRFNIVAFSTEARPYADHMLDHSKAAIAEAVDWLGKIKAAGGTNIHDALSTGMKMIKEPKGLAMVVFLTDGLATVGETTTSAILKRCAADNKHKARLFVFGVGYDVNTKLLDTLAMDNRGARDYVTPSQNIEVKMSNFFDKVAYPVMSDLSLSVDGIKISEVYPKRIPDLFKGTEVTVLGRYVGSGAKAIRLKGSVGGQAKELVFEAKFAAKSEGRDFVPMLWAKRKVGYLMDQIRLRGQNKELREEIVRLGKKFAIVTPYTSFLVTEEASAAGGGGAIPRRPGDGHWDHDGGRRRARGLFFGRDRQKREADNFAKAKPKADANDAKESGKKAVAESLRSKKLQADLVTEDQEAPSGSASSPAQGQGLAGPVKKSKLGRSGSRRVLRRQLGMTFRLRNDVWVQTDLDELDAKEAKNKPVEIEAFSKEYFDLVATDKNLSKLLAKMPALIIQVGDHVIWFKAPKAKAAK